MDIFLKEKAEIIRLNSLQRKIYKDLITYLKKDFDPESHLIVMGDLNISPEDIDIGIGENNRKMAADWKVQFSS